MPRPPVEVADVIRAAGKDHVDVARGQKLFLSRLKPEVAGVGLALGAVPVAAGAERDSLMAAAGTRIHMSAECGGAAAQDREEHLPVLPGEPLPAAFVEALSCCANH